jgi:hypothetical protein
MRFFTTLPKSRFVTATGRPGFVALFVFTAFFLLPFTAMSASAAFPATESGVTELKTLPAGLLVRSEAKGNYFEKNSDLFRPLFRYIQRKDIAMTTPVEAHVGDTSAMYFWIAATERAKAETDLPPVTPTTTTASINNTASTVVTGAEGSPQSTSQSMIDNTSGAPASPKTLPEGVVVLTRPERLVVSHGGRGGYSRSHFEEARAAALAWLATRPDLVADGPAYAVYWNSPFIPGFLKRYEVHIPVHPAIPARP